jgi:Xaa-Pro aminopeptidase
MRYKAPHSDLFVHNRQKLYKFLKPGSATIVHSNDIMPTNADGNMPFKQNADFYFLAGVDQEESVLVLFPDAPKSGMNEMLFIKKTNEHIAVWEGEKLSKEQAKEVSGIANIYWLDEMEAKMKDVFSMTQDIYLNSNEHTRRWIPTQTRTDRENEAIKAKHPLHTYLRLAPFMHKIRATKHPLEIEQMQKACDITNAGYRRLLKKTKPGMMEYELEAELQHEFIRSGSRGFAYEPIIASGASACVLHYNINNKAIKDGDLILLDIGAEYGNYAADLSRCIPANGKFSARQKEVYNAALRVQKACYSLLKPGVMLGDYHLKVGEIMTNELLELGLITTAEVKNQDPAWPAYKKYFMHGTSHFIGLDVHDLGMWHEPIEAGNCFTIEPGIYIQEEGLGVRIENDILITEDGFVDLMADIPREVEEIEDLMKG